MKATIKPNDLNEGTRDIYEELTKILAELLGLDLDVTVSCFDWGLTFETDERYIYAEALDIVNDYEGWDYEELND